VNPILKNKIRILRPSEYELLKEGARTVENQTNLDACLLLGARYGECRNIQNHREWFDGKFVHVPMEKKVKRKSKDRWIRLNPLGQMILPHFFENKPLPTTQTWGENMRRWAERRNLEPVGLCPRSLRKTWESWLVFHYPHTISLIFLSQGHTETTALQHYVNLPFTEKDNIKKWVEGWI